ncbi:MAG: DUF58 domain-containing protein [Polyangiaceae bacterium]|nr:DUF58 domain-containing protein [Polyangiaceae bacterium]
MNLARLLRTLRSKRELARLNHVLIPAKKSERDRFRRSVFGRAIAPTFGAYSSLSREGRVMFLVTLMIGLAGLDVMDTQVHLLFAMLSGLIVASLAARPFFRARGLQVDVDAPARVSVGASQRFVVNLTNAGKKPLVTLRVSAPFLPWDGPWMSAPEPVTAVRPGTSATTTAEARFLARGEHHLDAFEVGMLVPFGLAIGPRRTSNGAKFLVVPRIAPVASLALEHRLPSARDARVLSVTPGEAEFSSVRPYRSGDPLKHLHARTWARTGTPHVRSYVAEKSERVGIALALDGDVATETEKEGALSLAAGVAAQVVKSGAGLSAMSIDMDSFAIEPRSGRAALEAALDRLAVHTLTVKDEPVEAALEASSAVLSSMILVTADESPRRKALYDRLRARGLPVKWLRVTAEPVADGGGGEAAPRRVTLASIEAEEALRL